MIALTAMSRVATSIVLICQLIAMETAAAATHKHRRPPKQTEPASVSCADDGDTAATQALIDRASAAFASLDYGEVAVCTRAALRHADIATDQRERALLLLGTSLAIIGDPTDADAPFRELIRLEPGFDLPADTAPKVLAAFRRVQVEELARVNAARLEMRRSIISGITIQGALPEASTGGQPLELRFHIDDPSDSVKYVKAYYHKEGDKEFAALPLQLDASAYWCGEIPGAWTQSTHAYRLDWYVETRDSAGEALAALGSPSSPRITMVTPGEYINERPFYRKWWFWSLVGVGVVAAATTTYVIIANHRALPSSDLGVVNAP